MNNQLICKELTRFGFAFCGQFRRPKTTCLIFVLALTFVAQGSIAQEPSSKTVKVFILAGQSNMQGHGVVDLTSRKDYNSGKGSLIRVTRQGNNRKRMAHLTDSDGSWRTRNDVWVRYQTEHELKKGPLTIGFTGYEGTPHHIGPEFQFGHAVGDAFDEPVVIIKTAWGGKSLFKDFRPPSSGGEVGPYYTKMMEEIDTTLNNIATEFPQLKNRQVEVAGFVWQQGWNDMISDEATAEYKQNLLNLIKDIRAKFDNPNLPFVYGELGNGGSKADLKMYSFRTAQALAAIDADSNVAFVKTTSFARPASKSPNPGHLHHWYGNAESYFLLGDALAKEMIRLAKQGLPKVLILGDSISIGYTPLVKWMLSSEARVFRAQTGENNPEDCKSTRHGAINIDRWLRDHDGNWDLIHFNFGLHDIKHRDPKSNEPSNNPKHPMWVSPSVYESQLRLIVAKLKMTGAKLIFATTTPVPEGVRPFRATTDPQKYNEIALRVMEENGVEINDLYELANSRLSEIQIPNNVHFTEKGSEILGVQVANAIRSKLKEAVRK